MKKCYLSEIEEEAGVLPSFGEEGEEHCDTDEQQRGVLAHFTQRLSRRKTTTVQHKVRYIFLPSNRCTFSDSNFNSHRTSSA